MTDKYAAGLEVAEEMFGADVVNALKASLSSSSFGAQRGPLALGYVFGELWTRPGLDRRGAGVQRAFESRVSYRSL